MRVSVRPGLLLLAFALLCASGCDDEITTTPTPPTDPVTVMFTGTLGRNGAQTHPFDTRGAGTVTATLRVIEPAASAVVGFSLGTWNGTTSTCHAVLANDTATQSAVLTGTVVSISALCVRMYDVGNVPEGETVSYTVEVTYP